MTRQINTLPPTSAPNAPTMTRKQRVEAIAAQVLAARIAATINDERAGSSYVIHVDRAFQVAEALVARIDERFTEAESD